MDLLIRALIFLVIGLGLLTANVWFISSAYKNFISPEYVISPFNVVDPSGNTAGDTAGEALAQMMASRLARIQASLLATQQPVANRPGLPDNLTGDLGATALFIPRPVEIPTNLFKPLEFEATVGGVEVGGLFSYFQRSLAEQRAIKFTKYDKADKAVVTANLGQFAPGRPPVWFESEQDPNEITTNAAYALLHAKLSQDRRSRMKDLELADFRRLLETIIKVDELNHKALKGYVVTGELEIQLASIETQLENVPVWPELIYLAGSTAEGIGNMGKAVFHYRRLQSLSKEQMAGSDPDLVAWSKQRLDKLGNVSAALRSESEEKFVAAAKQFARRMSLEGNDPKIVFSKHEEPAIQAVWNPDKKQYEVNPPHVGTPGLPQYVALMGRFFDRNFDKCFGAGAPSGNKGFQFWNEFRYSVVEFLIRSQDEFKDVAMIGSTYPLFKALNAMQEKVGTEPVQRLALRLLEDYQCDWSAKDLAAKVIAIAEKNGLMPKEVVADTMADAGL